ncbi:hypothetical protein GCM10007884_38550 [Methylobacterium brachythecii]|uniref:Uncharacterized protein n=1 Tax=Methylobacterium brachythecii TaxID=1176177 RepID=A0ABQ6D6B3_9HYPH|nr:hypothetical protein GCM10007884_38550 [Methylobacterium brachythecii]
MPVSCDVAGNGDARVRLRTCFRIKVPSLSGSVGGIGKAEIVKTDFWSDMPGSGASIAPRRTVTPNIEVR